MTQVLFVGGSLHGQRVDVRPGPVTTDGAEPTLPAQFVNGASGETYVFETMRVPVQSPLADKPVGFMENDLYLLSGLYGDVAQSHAALADALTRLWLADGRRITADQAAKVDAAVDADRVPLKWYLVNCSQCFPAGEPSDGSRFERMPEGEITGFESLAARAKWAAGHLNAFPDHSLSFREEFRGGVPAQGKPGGSE